MKTVRILLNIGTTDQRRLQLERLYHENEVVELDDDKADILIKEGKAVDTNSDAERQRLDQAHRAAVAAAIPVAEREIVMEDAKREAKDVATRSRSAATVPRTTESAAPSPAAKPVSSRELDTNPHDQPLATKKP